MSELPPTNMTEIRLQSRVWYFDPSRPLGKPGGFGAVYEGKADDGTNVAIKKLHVGADQSAKRELQIALSLAAKQLNYIIPIYDSGEDPATGDYFVAMARAEKSLQQELEEKKQLSNTEAASVLMQIVEGLTELGGIVHRDIKPGNILLHDGKWKLADFGIARFVEQTTASQTLKGCLTPAYGAPEQWMSQRATVAADLYAVGCVSYCMLVGNPPFTEPDLRNQHLNIDPPPLPNNVPSKLRILVGMLLKKAPEARPGLERVKQILGGLAVQDKDSKESPIAEAAALVRRWRPKKTHFSEV